MPKVSTKSFPPPERTSSLTRDQRDQLAVDAMLPRLHPKGWSALKAYLQGSLDTAELMQDKSA